MSNGRAGLGRRRYERQVNHRCRPQPLGVQGGHPGAVRMLRLSQDANLSQGDVFRTGFPPASAAPCAITATAAAGTGPGNNTPEHSVGAEKIFLFREVLPALAKPCYSPPNTEGRLRMFDCLTGLALLAITAAIGYAVGKQAGLDEAGKRNWQNRR